MDVHETGNINNVTAIGHLFLHLPSTRNGSWVLDLPAFSCLLNVAARKLQVDIFQNKIALVLAGISTLQWAGVITTLLVPRARLDAFDRLMNEVGMTRAVTGMATLQATVASQIAAGIRGEL